MQGHQLHWHQLYSRQVSILIISYNFLNRTTDQTLKKDNQEEVKKELEQPVGYNQAREEEKKRNKERLEEIRKKRELAAKEKEE